MDICDRVGALYKRVVRLWDSEDGGRIGGADGGGDGEFGVDAESVGLLCAVRLGYNIVGGLATGSLCKRWTRCARY